MYMILDYSKEGGLATNSKEEGLE